MAKRGANVTFQLDADEAQAVQSFLRLTESQRKAERQFGRTTNAVRGQNRSLDKGRSAARNLGRTIVASFGAGSAALAAVKLIADEFNNLIERQRKASELSRQQAGPRDKLIGVTSGLSEGQFRTIQQAIEGTARRQAVPRKILTEAAVEAFSATVGDRDERVRQTRQAIRGAAFLAKVRPQETPQLSAGVTEILKKTPIRDPREAAGFLEVLRSQSRVSQPKKLTETFPQLLSVGQVEGASLATTSALFASAGSAVAESTGKETRTSIGKFFAAVDRFFKATDKFEDPGTAFERIRRIQQEADVRKAFFAQERTNTSIVRGVEAQFRGVIEKLLTRPESQVAQDFRTLRPRFTREQAREQAETIARRRREDPTIQNKRLGQQIETATNTALLTRVFGAQAGTIREQLPDLLQAVGETKLSQRITQAGFNLGQVFGGERPVEAFRETLERIERERRRRVGQITGRFEVGPKFPQLGVPETLAGFGSREEAERFVRRNRDEFADLEIRRGEVTEEERRRVRPIRERAAALRRLIEQLERFEGRRRRSALPDSARARTAAERAGEQAGARTRRAPTTVVERGGQAVTPAMARSSEPAIFRSFDRTLRQMDARLARLEASSERSAEASERTADKTEESAEAGKATAENTAATADAAAGKARRRGRNAQTEQSGAGAGS